MGFFVSNGGLGTTETEYAGTVPTPNTVDPTDMGDGERELKPHEKLRLGYLTGQMEDTTAPRKTGFMGGVDPDFPDWDEELM